LAPLTTDQVIKEVQGVVLQFPTKQVAAQAGSCPKAVEKVRNGENAMILRNFLNLCRANPRARAQLVRLAGYEETDPEFVEGLSLLMNSLSRSRAAEGVSPDEENCAGDKNDPVTGDLFGGSVH
jgi:hypothetical protein